MNGCSTGPRADYASLRRAAICVPYIMTESRIPQAPNSVGLVDAIVLTPGRPGETVQIELRGNSAAMLGATVQTKRSSESDLFW